MPAAVAMEPAVAVNGDRPAMAAAGQEQCG